jgi:propionyl-CoA carboxylase beta chain
LKRLSVSEAVMELDLTGATCIVFQHGSSGRLNIIYRREFAAAKDVEKLRQERVQEFREKFANPYIAAKHGFIDEIIEPKYTRKKLITALRMLDTKRDINPPKKHGNIPL